MVAQSRLNEHTFVTYPFLVSCLNANRRQFLQSNAAPRSASRAGPPVAILVAAAPEEVVPEEVRLDEVPDILPDIVSEALAIAPPLWEEPVGVGDDSALKDPPAAVLAF